MKKGILRIIFLKVFSFLAFLLILAAANYLTSYIRFSIYLDIVRFLVDNLYLSFVIFLVTMFSELLWNFEWPLNLVAPLFSATAGVFILEYIYRLWLLIEGFVGFSVVIPKGIILFWVFLAILIFGYIFIFARVPKRLEETEETKKKIGEKKVEGALKERPSVSWEEIGREFKEGLYNIGRAINRKFEPKVKKSKKKVSRR